MDVISKYFCFLIFMCSLLVHVESHTFFAGGNDGWVPNPSDNYADWASRNRFQVNDTIVFRYNKGENSVLLVSKQDYDACNINNPLQKLDEGNSAFKFPTSGPFYFISGNQDYCNRGQKLIVIVLTIRGASASTSPSTSSTPPPPSTSGLTPTPSGAPTLAPGSASSGATADIGGVPGPSPIAKPSSSNVVSLCKINVAIVSVILFGFGVVV